FHFFFRVFNNCRSPEYDNRAIIYRMMERRARQHQPVNERDRYANFYSFANRLQHAACRRAVNVKTITHSRVARWYDEGLVINYEPDMADERLVKNFADARAVKLCALRQSLQCRSLGRHESFHRTIAPGSQVSATA